MKDFLRRKEVNPSLHLYFIEAMGKMTFGLFATLIIGLMIRTFGEQSGFDVLIEIGQFSMDLYGAAIGAAVALALRAPTFVLLSAIVCGAAGAMYGGPAGSLFAAIAGVEVGKLVSGETKLDILVTPIVTIFSGFLVAATVGRLVSYMMTSLGTAIMWAAEQQPLFMSIIVAALMGLALTAPISSAAIALMLDLEGSVAAAAAIGCAGQMIGFAIASFRDNRWSGLVSLGLGTSMLQMPNIIRNPRILIAPVVAGMISAPIGTLGFGLVNNAAGAGMGTSGFVGPLMTFAEMGFSWATFMPVMLCYVLIPAVVSGLTTMWLKHRGHVQLGDMKISV
ncbi:PTS sugar transporter subunit IIC [Bacillus sp. FSL W7-1360]